MGIRNSGLGIRSANKMSAWHLPDNIEEDSAEAEAARRDFGAFCVEDNKDQYYTSGIQLGERYEGSPIICADRDPPPPDDWSNYLPLERAGARAPHYWREDGSSLYDASGAASRFSISARRTWPRGSWTPPARGGCL